MQIIESLEQDWVTDLRDLAGLSDVGWQYLRIPAMLKVVLRRRCDELFEMVPHLRNPKNVPRDRSPGGRGNASAEKRSLPSWRNANTTSMHLEYSPQHDSVREDLVHPALPIETDRGQASGESSQLIEVLRRNLKQAGVNSLRDINRIFGRADVNRDGTLSRAEFDRLIKEFRISDISAPQRIHALWNLFDRDKNGVVSSHEFIRTIRGRMTPQREAVVRQVFDLLDIEHTGAVQRWDLLMNFDPFPEAVERDVPVLDVLHNFLVIGGAPGGQTQSTVPKLEFLAYYDNVSSSVDADNDFAQLVRNTWHSKMLARQTPRYVTATRASLEETNHSAAAICGRIRQFLATHFTGLKPERQVARAIWQLVHDVSDGGMHKRHPAQGVDRDSFDLWIEELHSGSLPEVDCDILFKIIDVDMDGLMSPTDFLRALQGNSSKRQKIIEDAFERISNSTGTISWEMCEVPDDIVELLSMTHGSESLSKSDFIAYYLSCGVLLQDDRALENLLRQDWPVLATRGSSVQHAHGSVGSVASIAKGLGSVNPQRAWLSLASDLRPGSAKPGRHGYVPVGVNSTASNRRIQTPGWGHVAWPKN